MQYNKILGAAALCLATATASERAAAATTYFGAVDDGSIDLMFSGMDDDGNGILSLNELDDLQMDYDAGSRVNPTIDQDNVIAFDFPLLDPFPPARAIIVRFTSLPICAYDSAGCPPDEIQEGEEITLSLWIYDPVRWTTVGVAPVPLPASAGLLGASLGAFAVGAALRRRRGV